MKEAGRRTAFGMELRGQRDNIYGRLKVSMRLKKNKPVYSLIHLDGEKRTAADHVPEPVEDLWPNVGGNQPVVPQRPGGEGICPPFGGHRGSAGGFNNSARPAARGS